MSLETLLEAAEFLERNHNHFSNKNNADNNQTELNSVAGHLKIDPNLPISFQFHTYSSSLPNTSNLLKQEELDNRINQKNYQHQGRTKSASFSISNSCSTYQQNKHRRNRNLTSSDKTSINEIQIRHRELHKTLEKNRRAHLRSCFEQLKLELPKTEYAEKKYSHINIIHYAIHYINQLKKTELDYKEQLDKLNRIRSENKNSLFNLKQQIIKDISSNQTSSNQSNDSSSENLESSEDSDHDKRMYSIRTQKEIDDLLLEVEQSLLCASGNSENSGSELTTNDGQVLDLDNSEPDDYDDETTTASECADDQESYDNVSKVSTILNQCHA